MDRIGEGCVRGYDDRKINLFSLEKTLPTGYRVCEEEAR